MCARIIGVCGGACASMLKGLPVHRFGKKLRPQQALSSRNNKQRYTNLPIHRDIGAGNLKARATTRKSAQGD